MAKTYFVRFGFGDPRTYTGLAATFLQFTQYDGTGVTPPSIAENYNVTGGVTTGTGIYRFTYGTTLPISFLIDAATTSPGPQGRYVFGCIDPSDRADEYGTTIVAIGTSHIAQGNTAIALGTSSVALGTTAVALGTTSVALGTTSVALGTTSVALGTSGVALGTTNVAISTTILAQGLSLSVTVPGFGSTASSYGTASADPVDIFGYLKRIQENLEGNSVFVKSSGVMSIASRTGVTMAVKTIANSVSLVTKS